MPGARATRWPRFRSATSIMPPSITTSSPARENTSSRSIAWRSRRPRSTPPKTPTPRCGYGNCSSRASPARGRARGRDPDAGRRAAQSRQSETTRRYSVRQVWTSGRHQDQDRPVVDRGPDLGGPGRAGSRAAAENSRLATGFEAQIDLYRRTAGLRQRQHAPRPHELRARGDTHRAPVLLGAEPAEHSDPHRGRPQDPARLHRGRRTQARLRRLFPDRAAALGRDRRHRGAEEGVPRGPRHSRHDGFRNVRRAGQGHARGNSPPRQGHQLRHHLRHLGLRARQSTRHRARRGGRLHQEIFRALSRHPRLHGGNQGLRQEERLRVHPVRPQVPLPRDRALERLDPRLQRARRDQRAAAGHRRRHHPPRHGAHGGGAGEGQALRADAAAGARRARVRGARGRGGEDLAGGGEGDGAGADAGALALGPARGRGARRAQLGRGALSQTARPPLSSAKADDPVIAELDQRHLPGVDRTSTGYWMLAVAGMTISMIAILAPSPAHAAAGIDGAALRWPWALPFVGILVTIATGPLLFKRLWHRHYGKLAFAWCVLTLLPLAAVYGVPAAAAALTHVLLAEYLSFIVLLFALYVVAGGILLTGELRGTPLVNPIMLAFGTLIASVVGTTGAAMILIRPLLRANSARLHNVHVVVFFIFLVANIGGALSPLGDPPLFVGFLHGVDFFWTTRTLWFETVLVAGLVLLVFAVLDARYYRKDRMVTTVGEGKRPVNPGVSGGINLLLIAGIVGAILATAAWHPGRSVSIYGTTLE